MDGNSISKLVIKSFEIKINNLEVMMKKQLQDENYSDIFGIPQQMGFEGFHKLLFSLQQIENLIHYLIDQPN